jgi:superfamily II DNA or RNA helicase
MLEIKIENVNCQLIGQISKENVKELSNKLSYDHPGYSFMAGGRGGFGSQGKYGGWDGKVRLLQKNGKFPIGLLAMVKEFLNSKNIEYSIVDKRPILEYGSPVLQKNSDFEPRAYQLNAVKTAYSNGSGIIKMATGCHAKGTEVLMYDGSTKRVEEVVVGDSIMGPDSKPRRVLQLCRGKDRMVRIIPAKGEPFVINQEHILSLKRTRRRAGDKLAGNIEDIKFSEWEKLSDYGKHIRKLFRVGVDFSKKQLSMDPYFMGLLLGDGCPAGSRAKFIPQDYKTSDRSDRLSLLAGLLDADGSYNRRGYDFASKSEGLARDLAFVARSLGFAAYVSRQKKICTNNGAEGYYFRVSLSGDLSEIPCKLPRKKATKRLQKKDVLVTGFSYEEAGYDDYFGFKVDGDNRYLLSDFTVTHNSGKSFVISSVVAKYNIPTIVYVIGIELLYQMKKTIESAYGIECGIVGGGECDVSKQVTIMTIWSAASAFNKKVKITDNDTTSDGKRYTKALDKALVRKKVQEAQLFIFDECQYAASETLQFLHRASVSAKHRFLFSGTPWRDTGDDILIEAVSGPKIVDINATYLIKNNYLVKPKIYFLDVPVMRAVGKNYHDVYKNYVVENDDRNDLIVKAAKKLVSKGRKVLILVVRVGHGDVLMDRLSDDFRVKFLDGAKTSKIRMESIQEMKDGKLDILIASKIFDQGVDIPELDALILAGSGKSSGRALQRIGRVIRKSEGKTQAIVVEFFDNCKYLRDHSEARIKVYESEPGFDIKIQKNKALRSYPKRGPVKWT